MEIQTRLGAVDLGQQCTASCDVAQIAHEHTASDLPVVPLDGCVGLAGGCNVPKDGANVFRQVNGEQPGVDFPAIEIQQRFPGLTSQYLVAFRLSTRLLEMIARVFPAARRVELVVVSHLGDLGKLQGDLIGEGFVVVEVVAQIRLLFFVVIFPLHDAIHELFVAQPVGRHVGDMIQEQGSDDLLAAVAIDL